MEGGFRAWAGVLLGLPLQVPDPYLKAASTFFSELTVHLALTIMVRIQMSSSGVAWVEGAGL